MKQEGDSQCKCLEIQSSLLRRHNETITGFQSKKKSYQFYDVWLFRYSSAFCNDFYLSNRYLALQTLFNFHNSRHFSQCFKIHQNCLIWISKEVFFSETDEIQAKLWTQPYSINMYFKIVRHKYIMMHKILNSRNCFVLNIYMATISNCVSFRSSM